MDGHPLDNPVWNALHTHHRAHALRCGELVRYPPDIAPFVAVAREGIELDDVALAALLSPAEQVHVLGPSPRPPARGRLHEPVQLAQMVCEAGVAPVDDAGIVALSDIHREDVLALAALVYPHYFRARTPVLGRYFGVYEDGLLAAMIGERMRLPGWQEVSAVCTHPAHVGRGLARRLLGWLTNDILARGDTPFLHVSQQNLRALALYRRSGYRMRREIAFRGLTIG